MKKIIFLLVLGMVVSGCATMNPYGSLYNEAVAKGTSTTIIKEGDFKNITTYTAKHLASLGYEKVLYSDPEQGFYVLVKNTNFAKAILVGDAHMYKVILKYSKAGEGKHRIDLVNATSILWAKKDVDKDIQQISELIKKE